MNDAAEVVGKDMTDAKVVGRKRLYVPKAPEIVAGKIRQRIVRGLLGEGDMLPSEAKLMEEFGVARPTIREAFRILEAERLITVARGARGGAFIHAPDPELIASYALMVLQAEKTTIDEVYQSRDAVEPAAVRMAAVVASETAPAILRRRLEAEHESIEDPRAFAKQLALFHRELVEQSGNRPLIHLMLAVHEVVERHQARVVAEVRGSGVELDRAIAIARSGLRSHKRVIDLIEAGDADGAEFHWRRHMKTAYRTWISGYEGRPILELFGDNEGGRV